MELRGTADCMLAVTGRDSAFRRLLQQILAILWNIPSWDGWATVVALAGNRGRPKFGVVTLLLSESYPQYLC